MNISKTLQILTVATAAAFLPGCFEEKMPEVNDTNCQLENIKKLDSRELQAEFSSKCLRRSGFKESSGESFTVQ